MAAIVFPSSPGTNQVFAAAGSAWSWDGGAWRVIRETTLNTQLQFSQIDFNGATLTEAKFYGGSLRIIPEIPEPPVVPPANGVFYENDQEVAVDYTITTSKNAMSAGPITIASGVTVTIPDGSSWAIV